VTRQAINVGTNPNDYTGDPLRTAFQKTNANFVELYSGAAPAYNGGIIRSVLRGTFTLSAGNTSVTVAVPGMLDTDIFKFYPPPGTTAAITEAWQAWQWLQITQQIMAGAACDITITVPAAPANDLTYSYEVMI